MNMRDFQYLVAVAEHRHFGKAAEICHVSQPALSMQIKKMENTLGVQLFERDRKQIVVTQVGQGIIMRARKILHEIKEMKEAALNAQCPLSGNLRLGVFPTLAPYLLPNITPPIRKEMPELRLLLIEEKTELLLEKLHSGVLDCALLALPVEDEKLEVQVLFEEPFLLAVPLGHKLAKRKKVRQADMAGEQLLLLEEGHCLRSQALEVCNYAGMSEYQDLRATSMETLRQMVASGVGITLIPSLARRENDDIAYVPFSKPVPSRTIGLVWRKSSARKECCHTLGQIITQVVMQLPKG